MRKQTGRPKELQLDPQQARRFRSLVRETLKTHSHQRVDLVNFEVLGYPVRDKLWIQNYLGQGRPLPEKIAVELIYRLISCGILQSWRDVAPFHQLLSQRFDDGFPPMVIIFPGESAKLARVLASEAGREIVIGEKKQERIAEWIA